MFAMLFRTIFSLAMLALRLATLIGGVLGQMLGSAVTWAWARWHHRRATRAFTQRPNTTAVPPSPTTPAPRAPMIRRAPPRRYPTKPRPLPVRPTNLDQR